MSIRIVDRLRTDRQQERRAVLEGLMASAARIEPKYFYDPLGCALYGAICRLPEYYPTRTEVALFESHRREIADAVGQGRQLVDLGAGDCCKAKGWLPFLAPSRYIAVDIAVQEISAALLRMEMDNPSLDMVGLAVDFSKGLDMTGVLNDAPAVFFYPGSSIGNFLPEEAARFLSDIQRLCQKRPGSSLLIGVDGRKEEGVLRAAYDDALGVTAAFNRNVLRHLNARFGFAFDVQGFSHVARYDPDAGRVEMHLESCRAQRVQLGEQERTFLEAERIHTENSCKYHAADFEALLRQAGFSVIRHWAAPDTAYRVFHAA